MNKLGTLFGMVTTEKSSHLTPLAINSFLATTTLSKDDVFALIDNDNTWPDGTYPKIQVIHNQAPKSFAENINQLLDIAINNNLDLVMMNNDIILTPGWREALEKRDDIICLPACNQTQIYVDADEKPIFDQTVTLLEYNGRWRDLYQLAAQHKSNNLGYGEFLNSSFYLFRLPRRIYQEVGLFDTNFNQAGGEDVDYRIRAAQKGFKTLFTNDAYVLHLHGKSTWSGSESEEETAQRNKSYFDIFVNKWGKDLAYLLLKTGQSSDKMQEVSNKYKITTNDDFATIVTKITGSKITQSKTSMMPLENVAAPGLLPYIEALGSNLVGCELGVCMAFTLRYYLDMSDNISKVYAIDAWEPYMDHWGMVTQEMIDRWKASAFELLAPHKDRVEIIVADSFKAADQLKSESLDYIFIDGDHSYAAVAQDLRKYWDKVKPGGIFAGHDWNLPPVKAAVEHFRAERGIETTVEFTDNNVWFWYKGK